MRQQTGNSMPDIMSVHIVHDEQFLRGKPSMIPVTANMKKSALEKNGGVSRHRSASFHGITGTMTVRVEEEGRILGGKPSKIPVKVRVAKPFHGYSSGVSRHRSGSFHGTSSSFPKPEQAGITSNANNDDDGVFNRKGTYPISESGSSDTTGYNCDVMNRNSARSRTEQSIKINPRTSHKDIQLRRCISLYERERKPHFCMDKHNHNGTNPRSSPHPFLKKNGKRPLRRSISNASHSSDNLVGSDVSANESDLIEKRLRGPSPLIPSLEESRIPRSTTPVAQPSNFIVRPRAKSETGGKLDPPSAFRVKKSLFGHERKLSSPNVSVPSTPSSASLDLTEYIESAVSCTPSPLPPNELTLASTVEKKEYPEMFLRPTSLLPSFSQDELYYCSQVFVPETEDDYPPAKPPQKTKAEIFNPKDFMQVDQRALQAPASLAADSDSLIEYLVKDLDSDLAKLRAIFRWLTSQAPPLTTKVKDVAAKSPLDFLIKILEKKATYSELFALLCRKAGIQCVIIHGIAKSVAYDVGDKIKHKRMHSSWNAAYVEGGWHFVHPYWASHSAKGNSSGHWELVESDDFHKKDGELQNLSLSTLNDFYFLTDPEKFIVKCFPNDPDWQLLSHGHQITEAEFEYMPYIHPAFHELHLKLISHHSCLIHSENGRVQLRVAFPAERSRRYSFRYRLYMHRDWEAEGIYDPLLLDRYLLHYRHENNAVFDIRFPITGAFRLELHCADAKKRLPSDWICDFKIVCNSPVEECEPLPLVPSIGWGPGEEMANAGIKCLSHDHCIVSMDTDPVTFMRFALPKDGEISLEANLVSNNKSCEELSGCVNCEQIELNAVLQISPPTTGEFVLQVYTKEKNSNERKNVCNFLLQRNQIVEDPELADIRRKLEQATESGSVETLSHWIERFMEKEMVDQGELAKARKQLQLAKLNRDISEAIANKDLDLLEKVMNISSDTSLRRHLGKLAADAEAMRSRLRRLKRLQHAVLEMDQKTISELRSYPKPPPPVRGVMAATFLLLGNKEPEVKKWRKIQSLISKRGKDGLKRRVAEFRTDSVPIPVFHQVRGILNKYDLETIQIASAGAATFYQWATTMTAEIEMEMRKSE